MNEYMNKTEVAKYLDVTLDSISRYCRKGYLNRSKPARGQKFLTSEVIELAKKLNINKNVC